MDGCAYIRSQADEFVTNRETGKDKNGDPSDMLNIMLNSADPKTNQKLNHLEMVEQIMTQLSNGFNGPAITLAWFCYTMSLMPVIEEKLIQEIETINQGDENHVL